MKKEVPTHLNFRIDPKLRYLLGIAAQARNMSFTEYCETALWESFKNVSIDEYPEMSEEPFDHEPTRDEIIERANQRENAPVVIERSLHKAASALWDERPFTRLAMLNTLAPHLMNGQDKAMWNHIHAQKAFKMKDGKVNRALINEEWDEIQKSVLDSSVASAKGKAKGND